MKKLDKQKVKSKILKIFSSEPKKQFNYKQISKLLHVGDKNQKKFIIKVLDELTKSNDLKEMQKGKFKLSFSTSFTTGILNLAKKNNAIVYSSDLDEDIFIPQDKLNHALHGDNVEVTIYARSKKAILEGQIDSVLERGKDQYVGTVSVTGSFAFLIIKDRFMPYDVFIPINKLNGAKQNDKAIVKIVKWPESAKSPIGEVIEVLGQSGDHETEMHAILAEFDLPHKFPDNIKRSADRLSTKITQEEIEKRRDFRNITTLTIDPADAKDFDDALSLTKLENGNFEVGVHIADVTHYVKPRTLVETEAASRATSVYLVDRVVPMIPEKLSNSICSLQPHVDKLTFSAVFELDEDSNVKNEWFGKTIINSNRRFNYEEVQEIIETNVGDLNNEIITLNECAKKIRNKRFKNGAISFERGEIRFILDDAGKPTGVKFIEPSESHQLIEEFMLLANKKVAKLIGKTKSKSSEKAFVYRVHDEPDNEKLHTFSKFVKKFGYEVSLSSKQNISSSFNKLFKEIGQSSQSEVIQNMAIRSMAKAVYTSENIGHYGLGFEYYTHFTSPIRRYPDMMVHRLLERYLAGKKSANKKIVEDACKHSSAMEQRAVLAERASKKYKAVEFMKDKLGEEFEGVITGVTEFGIFVEIIEFKIEGLVMIRDMDDDFYSYDEENYCLTGHYTKKKFMLGNTVNIKIIRANIEKRQLDFGLVKDENEEQTSKHDFKKEHKPKKKYSRKNRSKKK